MFPILCLVALSFLFFRSHGQSTLPNAREPEKKHAVYAPKTTKARKFKKSKITRTARYEFYERIEKAAREKKRLIRKFSKAQYTDYRYFGHKHIPKRRSIFRMRYCKECGIRH